MDERAFRVMSAFWRIIQRAAQISYSDCILVDLGPNLGAINRAALIAADYVVIPLAPDLFSIQGLRNLGPTLRTWREGWHKRLAQKPPSAEIGLPAAAMEPAGYVVRQPSMRLDRPVKAYQRWIDAIPQVYQTAVLGREEVNPVDDFSLGIIRHYHSLVPMTQDARKPIFALQAPDGAIGARVKSVQSAYEDFKALALSIADRVGLALPVRQ